MLRKWEELPEFMRCEEVREYYDFLSKKKPSIVFKRGFDVVVALILLVILVIPMVIITFMIKADSKGPVFYRQERVTTYGKVFRIHKFRTMVVNADKIGTAVTVGSDCRVTKIGGILRKYRLDELPQLLDVLKGDMSFVGTRPEVTKYVEKYTKQMNATLLLPAGITSEASIRYKDEEKLLDAAEDVDKVYVEQILPEKMFYNLRSMEKFSFLYDIKILFMTVFAVFGQLGSDRDAMEVSKK